MGYILVQWVSNNLVSVHARQNQWILKRLKKQVEIKENKLNIRIAKKTLFSVFPCLYHYGRTAVTFYQAILSGTSL